MRKTGWQMRAEHSRGSRDVRARWRVAALIREVDYQVEVLRKSEFPGEFDADGRDQTGVAGCSFTVMEKP